MKCPNCKDTTLSISNRHDIEIDYCPDCRGVWLDRGELDKIIEKAVAIENPAPNTKGPESQYYNQAQPFPGHQPHPKDFYKYKRRKSWLEEIFD